MPDGTLLNAVPAAEAEVDDALKPLPILNSDLPASARLIGPVLAAHGDVFDRSGPVRIDEGADGAPPKITQMGVHDIVNAVHRTHQPMRYTAKGEPRPDTLPERVAHLFLASSDRNLRPLDGISFALLTDTDEIRTHAGYDARSRLWCVGTPPLNVVDHPTREDADTAFLTLREFIATFAFDDDAPRVRVDGVSRVNTSLDPGVNESVYIMGLVTAAMRPNLPLAPGLLVTAPHLSGSGTGKGLAVRVIALIAYGISPAAVAAGPDGTEMDKRIVTVCADGRPVVLLDNVNDRVVDSDQIAIMLTERSCEARILGHSRMVMLHPKSFFVITGNGSRVGKDLTRRFIQVRLDAHDENPELRRFPNDLLADALEHRARILSAIHTIIRWGRQNRDKLKKGLPFGSYPEWCALVRDPLLTLGCRDPVEAAQEAKQEDPHRREQAELFAMMWKHHGDRPFRASELADPVEALLNPQGRGRQWTARKLQELVGSRAGGFVLTSVRNGKSSAITYSLQRTDDAGTSTTQGRFQYVRRDPELLIRRIDGYDMDTRIEEQRLRKIERIRDEKIKRLEEYERCHNEVRRR